MTNTPAFTLEKIQEFESKLVKLKLEQSKLVEELTGELS